MSAPIFIGPFPCAPDKRAVRRATLLDPASIGLASLPVRTAGVEGLARRAAIAMTDRTPLAGKEIPA